MADGGSPSIRMESAKRLLELTVNPADRLWRKLIQITGKIDEQGIHAGNEFRR